MKHAARMLLLISMLMCASPAIARVLKVVDWQAAIYRVTHRDKNGNFDQDTNYAYMLYDYEAASNAMRVGYDRAVRANAAAIAEGKPPLFCPPKKYPELRSDEINTYLNTLPLDYRKKTTMVDAMLGFAVRKFQCQAAGAVVQQPEVTHP